MKNNDVDKQIQKIEKELDKLKKQKKYQELQEEKEKLTKELESNSKKLRSSKYKTIDGSEEIKIPLLKSKSIFLMILYTFLTLGLYVPYWFLSRQNNLNKLPSKTKVEKWIILVLMILFGLRIITNVIGDTSKPKMEDYYFMNLNESGEIIVEGKNLEEYSEKMNIHSAFSLIYSLLSILIFIFLWTLSFKVKDILQDSIRESKMKNIKLSSLWTFFFGILYLQHKINQINKKGIYTITKTVNETQSKRIGRIELIIVILLSIVFFLLFLLFLVHI